MARHFQSGFGFGSGQRSFDSRTGSGSGLGSMSGSLGPSSLSASGSRMSGSGGLSYSSTYDSGLNTSRYGTSSYSQSGYDNQSYSSSSYQHQNPGYSTSNTAAYRDYGGPSRSGLGGTSSSTYSGSYIGLGTSGVMATREFGGSGFDSVYDKSGQSSGSRLDSDYRRDTDYRGGSGTGYTGSNSNLRSTTDTLTLSDFIDDKRGDKSWDPVKRKYRYEPDEEDTSKRQRYSRGSSEGRESDRREERRKDDRILLYLGNMPSNVTKEKIETMFAYIPGIVSYSLQRHKYNMSNTCIFVEMTSRESGENLRKTFDWMEVNGRCIVCRFCKDGEEDNFIPDPLIRSDNFEYKSGETSQSKPTVESRSCVYVSNLPGDSTKDDLESFVSDLNYRSIDFVKGDHITGKTGYAYFEFDHTDDGEKMVNELQGTYYLGNYINARIEEGKTYSQEKDQDDDDYLPVPLGEAEVFVSQGSRKSADRAPAAPAGARKQPSPQFEEYIKGQEDTPLIGLEYVTEYSTAKKNTPRYQCELCAATPQGSSVLAHIISAKHRLNYMERKDPERYQRITAMSQQKSFLTAEGLKYATEVEGREGRQLIKIEHNRQNVGPQIQDQDLRQKPEIDQSSDLFSRLIAYKQKIKEIEDKQKEKQFPGSSYRGTQQARTSEDEANEQRNEAKSVLKQQLSRMKEPILGLEFLKAQHSPLKPSAIPFNCKLCGSQLGHHSSAIPHVTGLAHRLEYFKRRHHDLYLVCSKITNRSSQRKLVEEHSIELERSDGRGTLYIDGELIAGEDKETGQPSVPAQQSSAEDTGEVEMDFEEDFGSVQARLFDLVKNMDDVPLVGLRYVTETQSYNSYDAPKYKCSLCDVNISKTFIVTHVTGQKHRLEYIKKNYPELEKDAESDRETLNNYCRDIENDIGREPVNVVMMRPPKDLNSPVTYSKPIPVKAPSSKAVEIPPQEPKQPPALEEIPAWAPEPTPTPALAAKITKPEILMSKMEKRAAALQKKIENRDKLTPQQQEELNRQLKNDGKKEDGSVVHFYDLIEEHESEPLLGLASCVEVWHPKDLEPPLFRCDICDFDTNFKHIVEHLMGKQHKMEYFKWMHPEIYQDIMRIGNLRLRDNLLKQTVQDFDKTHVRETIQYTVATDDTPWKNWKNKVNLMAYMRFDARKRENKLEKEKMAAESTPQFVPEPRQLAPEQDQQVHSSADKTVTVGTLQEEPTAHVPADQMSSVADLIDHPVISDEKWEEVNAAIKKRIGEGKIIIKKDPAKFLKTYKPFLTKFPIIGLEWLSEFQLGDENADPWYLCRLCRSKITWNDVVDHVISIYHRMSFIQKEHPALHDLLKEEMWKPGGEREMNDKIEEFAKGIAKPPSEQTLEVLLEKVIKPDNILPMKDVPSMAQRQGVTEQVRPLDFDMGQGGQPSQGPRSSGSSALVEPRFQQTSQQQEPGVMITGSDPPPQLPLITGKQAARNARRASLNANKVPGAVAKFPILFGNRASQALVGLEYLVEIQIIGEQHKKPEYVCELCDCECGPSNVLQHICGYKHRTNFFTATFPDRPPGQITEQMASDYEKQHGRGKVQVVIESKDAKKLRELDSKHAKKEVREAKIAFREHNLKEHQTLEKVRLGHEQPQDIGLQTSTQDGPEKETPASRRGLKITPGAKAKFPIMFGSKATRALVGLEHLVEIQMIGEHKERRPNYLCEICDADIGPGCILQHLYGHKHRQKFLSSLGRPVNHVTEQMANNHEKMHGRGRVRVVIEDRQSRRIREKERLENLKDRKEQPAQGSSDNSIKSQMPSASQSFPQAIPTATVTGPAPISSTIQPLPGNTFTGQQMPIVQEERFSPFAQQNLQQPIQGPQPLIQMQGQPPFQQPGPLMQQQPPTLIQQQAQSLMQHGPPMMQQTQQTVPPIMQQQLQQRMPLMDQPQIIQPGFNVSVQQPQPPQMQPPQMVIQQPQMMPQMSSNMGPMGPQQNVAMGIPNVGPQQNVPFGMPNMGPQQNIQMRPSGMAQPGSSQHGMVPNSQSVVRPQLGIPQSKNIPFGGPVQRPQGYDRPFMNQQHQSQFSNSQSFPRSQNRQLTTVNIQKTNVNQTKAVKSTNHESSQKSSQSNFTSRKEPDLSSYKIPKKDSPRKGVQDTKSDDKQRGRTDSRDARKPEESTKRGTSDNRPSSSQAKDTKNTKDDSRSSSSAGRHQDSRKTGDSRSGRSGSRDSRGSGSRRDRDRSPGSRKSDSIKYIDHRKSEKEKSTGFIYRDHRPSERSSDSRYTDRRKQPSKEGDRSKTSDKPGGNKEISETVITPSGSKPPDSKNEESSKESKLHVDRKQANERNDKSDERKSGSHVGTGDRETRVDKSKEKSEQGAGIKTDNKQKNQDDGKSKIDSNKLSDKTKPLESKTKEENKSKISDNKERDDISRATDNRSKSSGSKSGSFIEIESSDSIKKSTGKEESAASSCVITVDIVPKRKHERTDSQDDSKSKHAKIAASPANASSSSASRNKDIGKKESVHELVKDIKPDRIDKQDKIVPTKVDIKEEVFKSPVNNPKGKLACAVTVDLVDISTLSQVQLKELKQGSPQKETPTGGVVLEASSVKLDLKPKIKEEILSPKSKPKIKEEIISPKSKIKEEVVSPQGKSKEARTGPEAETGKQKETTVAAVMVKKEVTSPVSERKAEKRVELTKRESVVSERKDIWSVTDEWAENDAMDVHHESQKNSNKVLRKAESQSADKVNVVVEVEIGDKNEKAKRLSSRNEEKAKAMIPGCSVTVEMGDDVKEPEAMEFDVSSKDDQTGDGDNEQSDDDDFIDFSEFVTLDEEGEVDDMNIGSVHAQVEETSKLSLDKKESRSEKSRSSRSRSRERSRKSGQSDHKSPRRTRSRDRHRSRSDRSKSKDKWSTRSGKSGDGDSKRSGSSHGQEITEDSRRHLRSQPPDDIHLEDSVKQQKPSRAYQYCPAKGCNTSTKLLKAHVYTAHIPSLFHQLEEEDRRKNDIHRQRLNGLRQLAVGILGEHSSIHDLVEYLNQNLSIVIVHPATTIWSPLQTDMQALCQFAGWPVPDNFRVYPDINSPASLLYWRILLFLMDELPEQERREFYTSYNIPSIEQDNEEGTSRVSDADSRSPRRDKTLSTSKSERVSEEKSGTSSSRTKAPTRMTVEVEVSDKPTKSEKPDGDKTEEGLVAMSRALLKEKSRSSSGHGTKSNKCSVEVGVVEDSKKSEKADDCKTKDSDKQTDARETRSRRQTRSQKPKCEVSVSIN